MAEQQSSFAVNRDRVITGPILRTVISLSVPVMIGMMVEFALSVTDFYWVGKLGASAQDAITSSMVVIWTVFATLSLISIGLTALVSRHIGSGESSQAAYFTRQGLALAIVLGVGISLAGYVFTPVMLSFMGAAPDTYSQARPYLRIFFISTILYAVSETTYATFRAAGDTRTPTIIGVIAVALNMILDPLLIFGYGPFPTLGVPGAGLASLLSMVVAATAAIVMLFRGKAGFDIGNIFRIRPHVSTMLRIARIGLPISGQQLVFVVVYWFLIKIVHEFGEAAGAAMGIGNRMESLSYLTVYGVSIAASTMVGQNLGARNASRAARCAWGAIGLGLGITLAISIVFLTVPEAVAGVFSSDKDVLPIAIDYLLILGLSQTAMAIEIILEGAFSGAGDTLPPMLVGVPGSLARIPLAYWLAFGLGLGINGVWWTLTITSVAKALILALWFAKGRWKQRII